MDKKGKTLCWSCENTNRYKCPWFDFPPKEVDGWIAGKTYIMNYECGAKPKFTQSYFIQWCPLYLPIPKRKIKREKTESVVSEKKAYLDGKRKRLMGIALRNCRLDHDMTQNELARYVGKIHSTISAYEYGRMQYDVNDIRKWLPDIDTYIKREMEKENMNEVN